MHGHPACFYQRPCLHKGGPRSGYNCTTVVDLKTTPVKNQQSVGTCWDYATLSFLESITQRQTCL